MVGLVSLYGRGKFSRRNLGLGLGLQFYPNNLRT